MDPQKVSLSIDEDIAETQKLLGVVIRPVVRDRLLQLLHALQQVNNCHCCLSSCIFTYVRTSSGQQASRRLSWHKVVS